MAVSTGIIERSVVRETIRTVVPRTLDALGEIEQQIQVAVSGTANDTIAWVDLDVVFDVEFVNGTSQRYSNLTVPQMTFGSVIDSTEVVAVTACVRGWSTDERGVIVGATVAVGAFSPGASITVAFAGAVHLTFQGFGSLPNEPADPDFTA